MFLPLSIYSQLLIHTAKLNGAVKTENNRPRCSTAAQDSNLYSLNQESYALPLSHCVLQTYACSTCPSAMVVMNHTYLSAIHLHRNAPITAPPLIVQVIL